MLVRDIINSRGSLHTSFETVAIYDIKDHMLYMGEVYSIPEHLKNSIVLEFDAVPDKNLAIVVPCIITERSQIG